MSNSSTDSAKCSPSRSRQLKFSGSANERKEVVISSLPISMHTGQIIMLTKMLTQKDLRFYYFSGGVPEHTWR